MQHNHQVRELLDDELEMVSGGQLTTSSPGFWAYFVSFMRIIQGNATSSSCEGGTDYGVPTPSAVLGIRG